MMNLQKKHMLPAIVLTAGLLLGGCKSTPQGPPAGAPGPMEVNTMAVSAQPARLTVELSGRTAAFRIAEVRPQVSGIVQKRLFTEGSEVKAGELLYQIDPATYQAASTAPRRRWPGAKPWNTPPASRPADTGPLSRPRR